MSTPIETNTEELQEILQTVYNLPNAGGSGSSKPDLTIKTAEGFDFVHDSNKYINVTIDPNEVVSTYDKLKSGKDVRATLTGSMPLSQYYGDIIATYPAERVLCYVQDWDLVKRLVVRFRIPCVFGGFSYDEKKVVCILYSFTIDADGSVNLGSYALWEE